MRVNASTVRRWEAGSIEVPFTAFELLRLVYESANFRLSHTDWDGWFIGNDGRLVSPDIGGLAVGPADINLIAQKYAVAVHLQNENKRLSDALAEAQAENTRLREQFVNQGVVDEIDAMRNHLTDLLSRLNTAKVYPFPATTEPQQKEAAA